jgi:2-keto-4-pentenoate hydratase/2-oxohepta-3-ene-1,7-dioic acid hydratase in catechol pathway
MSFLHAGKPGWGPIDGDAVVDLSGSAPGAIDLRAAMTAGLDLKGASTGGTALPLADVTFLPVIPNPDKVICVGLNYATHIAETGREPPGHPVLFTRYPQTHVGHDQAMVRPAASEKFDFEGELAVVIGKPGWHVAKEEALDIVAGYTCFNDGTIRDYQRHTGQFTPGKNFRGSGAMGPWLVTTDAIPDPSALTLITRLNGEVMQQAQTDDLVFGVADIIAYVTTFLELYPGDVIATGTTGGVGAFRKPPLWMKAGDRVEVEISAIGTLSNPVEDEA